MSDGVSPTLPRLAALDWPPPPSPAAPYRPTLGDGGSPAHRRRVHTAETQARARAQLWAIRTEIDREKVRSVAPYPFLGCAMRFEDEFAALQIAEDGRFSYSTRSATLDAGGTGQEKDAPDHSPGHGKDHPEHRKDSVVSERRTVVTYEGVFLAPHASSQMPGLHERAAPPVQDVAEIEGQALVRYEVEEYATGARFVAVDRCNLRFAIAIGPHFRPKTATVSPLSQGPRTPGRALLRSKQLPYVGPGPASSGGRRERNARPRTLKCKGGMLRPATTDADRHRFRASASAPQLPSLAEKASQLDWKETYRQRAALVLGHRTSF